MSGYCWNEHGGTKPPCTVNMDAELSMPCTQAMSNQPSEEGQGAVQPGRASLIYSMCQGMPVWASMAASLRRNALPGHAWHSLIVSCIHALQRTQLKVTKGNSLSASFAEVGRSQTSH